MHRVSVIVPVYNSESFLEETITSVIKQSYPDWELILVDDGSTDNSREIIERFCQADPRISSVFQENSGVSTARNSGLEKATGEIIAFLDSDDVWDSVNLELKVHYLVSGDSGMVHSNASFIDVASNAIEGVLRGKEGQLLESMLLWQGPSVPGPSSVVLWKSTLEDVGNFDDELSTAADMDLFIRIAANYTIGHVDEVTWKYRIHDKNMHGDIGRMEKDNLAVYRKVDEKGLFPSSAFRRKAYGTLYRIIGASWAGDGDNFFRGLWFLFRSALIYPAGIPLILKRGGRKLRPT